MNNVFNKSLQEISKKHENEIKDLQLSFNNTELSLNSLLKTEIYNQSQKNSTLELLSKELTEKLKSNSKINETLDSVNKNLKLQNDKSLQRIKQDENKIKDLQEKCNV